LSASCGKNKFKEDFEEIDNYRFQYRKMVTGGNFQSKGFKYTTLDHKEGEKIYHKFDNVLCILIFKINRP